MIRLFAVCLALVLALTASLAVAQWPGLPILRSRSTGAAGTSAPTVTGVALNGGTTGSYTSGAGSGTAIGPIAVTMSDSSTFDGTLATSSGTPGSYFSIASAQLQTNGTTPTCTTSTPYNFSIIATPGAGEVGSPFTQAVTVTCNPSGGGVACNVGPNAPSVPAPAQAASFTTCAANYDFTNNTNFTDNGHTYSWGTLSTWLDCAGSSNPLWTIYSNNNNCHVHYVSDGAVPQVLDIYFDPSADFSSLTTTVTMQTSGSGNNSNLSQALFTVPNARYVEFVVRTETNTQTNACNGCETNNTWSWGGNGNPNFIEWDYLEMYQSVVANGGIGHPWDGATLNLNNLREPGMQSGYDPTQYHTYGFRIANDTSGNVSVCNYLDGTILDSTLQGAPYKCATGSYTPVPLGRSIMVLSSGPNVATNYTVTGHFYIQWLRVWECSGYATGECYNTTAQVTNGGALTGPP